MKEASVKKSFKRLISPSILSADFANLQSEIQKLTTAGADWIHVDVMDGNFVPNISIGLPVVEALKRVTTLPLDVHLMIERPERYIEAFMKAGSTYLTIHVESTHQVESCLKQIRKLGGKAGLSLRPRTPVEALKPYLGIVDLVLVMTVEPGFGGQSFMLDQVQKLDWLDREREGLGLQFLIEVDGGINDKTKYAVGRADVLVAGSYVFKDDPKAAIQSLRSYDSTSAL